MKRRETTGFRFAASLALVLCVVFAETASAQVQTTPQRSHQVVLEKGELLELALDKPLDSSTAKEGEAVTFHVNRALVSGGETVLPAGFEIRARITDVRHAEPNCRNGRIEWRFEDAVTPYGTRFRFRRASAFRPKGGGKPIEIDKPMSVGQKIGMVATIIVLSPLFAAGLVLAAPWAAIDAIEYGGPSAGCGNSGTEQVVLPGSLHYAALRRDVRVTLPDKTDEPTAPAETPAATEMPKAETTP